MLLLVFNWVDIDGRNNNRLELETTVVMGSKIVVLGVQLGRIDGRNTNRLEVAKTVVMVVIMRKRHLRGCHCDTKFAQKSITVHVPS